MYILNLVWTPNPTGTSQLSFSFQSDAKSTEDSAGAGSVAGVLLPGTVGVTSSSGVGWVGGTSAGAFSSGPVGSPFLLRGLALAFTFPSPVFLRGFLVLGSALSPSPLESSHPSSPFDRFLAAALTCKWLFESIGCNCQFEFMSENVLFIIELSDVGLYWSVWIRHQSPSHEHIRPRCSRGLPLGNDQVLLLESRGQGLRDSIHLAFEAAIKRHTGREKRLFLLRD